MHAENWVTFYFILTESSGIHVGMALKGVALRWKGYEDELD